MNRYNCALLTTLLFTNIVLFAQEWLGGVYYPNVTYYEAQAQFDAHWQGRKYEKHKGWKQYQRWAYFRQARMSKTNDWEAKKNWHLFKRYEATYLNNNNRQNGTDWEMIGPSSIPNNGPAPGGMGRLNCITFHPTQTNTIFVGSPSGGLWKTTNGGVSWIPLTDYIPNMGVSDLVINPNNPDVMYLATGDSDGGNTFSIGVLKSVDGGDTWLPTGLNQDNLIDESTVNKLIMHPTNTQILLAATSWGIFKTTNGGETWEQKTNVGWFKYLCFKPDDPNVVYATGYQYFVEPTSFSKFYKSVDGGDTWPMTEIGGLIGRVAIGVSPTAPNLVYLLTSDYFDGSFYGFYKSLNAGGNFVQVTNSPNIVNGQGLYNLCLAIAPNNEEEVFVGGVSLFKTPNSGVSWIETVGASGDDNYVHADMHELAFHPITGDLFVACDGGLFKSTDNGETWTDLSDGLAIMQYYRIGVAAPSVTDANVSTVLGGTQDNGAVLFDANSWGNLFNTDVMECAINNNDIAIRYFATQGGSIWKSVDDDDDDAELLISPLDMGVNENGSFVAPFALHEGNSQVMYVAYQSIWKSTNGGNTWSNFSGDALSANAITSMAVAESNTSGLVYASDGSNLFVVSADGVQTINLGFLTGFVNDIVVHPQNELVLWMCTSQGEVIKSIDGGQNFTPIAGSLPHIAANTLVYQKNSANGLYIGMDIGVYYKDDNLTDWEPFFDALPYVIVSELEIDYCKGKIIAATFGRGLWQCDLYSGTPECSPQNCIIRTKVVLSGSYSNEENKMHTNLVDNGLIPIAQPYNEAPWNYWGNESINMADGYPDGLVDWVLVEVRDVNNTDVLLGTAAGLLLDDGRVVDSHNYEEAITIKGLLENEMYYIIIRHRNHLDVMTSVPVLLPNEEVYDFSTNSNAAMGESQLMLLGNTVYGLYAGDYDANGIITVNDFNAYANQSAMVNIYTSSDGNLDRSVTVADFNLYEPNTSIIGVAEIRY